MRRAAAIGAALALAACGGTPAADTSTPGGRLEAAAVARGLVHDPRVGSLAGAWARDTDRLCIVAGDGADTIGAASDYGEGQGCVARGTVTRRGESLRIALGACRFTAGYDGERIAFPAVLPPACEALCTGRASLAALAVERLSDSASEASAVRAPDGAALCPA